MSDDAITRLNAALEGRYAIERELGEGGMATVYLAEDLKHERKVAIKVLKPELAAIVGGERFLAEIKTTANLQHPNILALYDSGEAGEFLFYVMPYVEGESLRDKLDREKQLGVKDSLALTRKVADALDYAHGHGVVHRDIKPENILLSERGEPLVADFGIALAVAQAGGGRITETGLSLGTPHYMSPEQATGDRDVDPRSDVFALGCVLYEMLAAQTPFAASTAQAILVRVLTSDPVPITTVRRMVPPHVEAVLARALEKLPADRFESATEFASALEDEGFTYQTRPRAAPAGRTSEVLVPEMAARPWHQDRRLVTSLVAGAALALAAWWLKPPPPLPPAPTLPVTRSLIDLGEIVPSPGADLLVSPDGSRFAVEGAVDGQTAIYWRDAAEENFRIIPGTENAREPAFSPDGEWLVYRTLESAVLKVSLLGGAPTTVVPAGLVQPREPHWGDDHTIVFRGFTGLYRVPDTGGEPELLGEAVGTFRHPSLLPGGRAVLGSRPIGGIVLFDVETDSIRELVPNGVDPRYVETGHILYADAAGSLWALPFDASREEVMGDAVPVLDGISMIPSRARFYPRYSVSRNGTLVYGAGGGRGGGGALRRLLVVDLEGNVVEELPLGPREFSYLRWSPNGESIVYAREVGDQDRHIFTYNVELGTAPRQLTFEGDNIRPVWSPDGTRVAFVSTRQGTEGPDLFVKSVTDDSPAERLLTLPGLQLLTHWVSDDTLVFEHWLGPGDLWMLDMSSDSPVATEYLPSEALLRDMKVSPTGDLAAYTSNESSTNEVYVRSFPEPGALERVSQGGGVEPFWSPDGNTIYYWTQGQDGSVISLMAAQVQRGPPFAVTTTDTVLSGAYFPRDSDLHPDGDRIVVTGPVTSASADAAPSGERFVVVVNWFEELKERMGGN